jgi:hypothetical protein
MPGAQENRSAKLINPARRITHFPEEKNDEHETRFSWACESYPFGLSPLRIRWPAPAVDRSWDNG